jgi:hypothetical protein
VNAIHVAQHQRSHVLCAIALALWLASIASAQTALVHAELPEGLLKDGGYVSTRDLNPVESPVFAFSEGSGEKPTTGSTPL